MKRFIHIKNENKLITELKLFLYLNLLPNEYCKNNERAT